MSRKRTISTKEVKGWKGFHTSLDSPKEFICRTFKYKPGKTYTQKQSPELCSKGFHFCKEPIHVLGYYSATDDKAFCKVIGSNETVSDGIKSATNSITIGDKFLTGKEFREFCIKKYKGIKVEISSTNWNSDKGYSFQGNCIVTYKRLESTWDLRNASRKIWDLRNASRKIKQDVNSVNYTTKVEAIVDLRFCKRGWPYFKFVKLI